MAQLSSTIDFFQNTYVSSGVYRKPRTDVRLNSKVYKMLEDKILIWKFKRGNKDAVRRIYEKYLDYLLTLAMGLMNDFNSAEDIVHDVFISFVKSAERIKIDGNLKGYLGRSVVNRVRDHMRKQRKERTGTDDFDSLQSPMPGPGEMLICREQSLGMSMALVTLPEDQREVIVLHLNGGMTFKEIAGLQNVSVNTVQGRYRYGIDKLRSGLKGETK